MKHIRCAVIQVIGFLYCVCETEGECFLYSNLCKMSRCVWVKQLWVTKGQYQNLSCWRHKTKSLKWTFKPKIRDSLFAFLKVKNLLPLMREIWESRYMTYTIFLYYCGPGISFDQTTWLAQQSAHSNPMTWSFTKLHWPCVWWVFVANQHQIQAKQHLNGFWSGWR